MLHRFTSLLFQQSPQATAARNLPLIVSDEIDGNEDVAATACQGLGDDRRDNIDRVRLWFRQTLNGTVSHVVDGDGPCHTGRFLDDVTTGKDPRSGNDVDRFVVEFRILVDELNVVRCEIDELHPYASLYPMPYRDNPYMA